MGMRKPDEGCKDPKNRSEKYCCCGSHSANDRKKSLTHHSTVSRLLVRKSRQLKQRRLNAIED